MPVAAVNRIYERPNWSIGLGILADDRLFSGHGERLIVLADKKRVFDDVMTVTDTKLASGGVFQSLSVFFPH